MNVIPTNISDVLIIEPDVFEDRRGYFFESFNQQAFDKAVGNKVVFVQDNHSKSAKNVLRGLHYQRPPKAQGKLVRVVLGQVFDVAVDIREGSLTFGKWVGMVLSAENRKQIWIPSGFAHGFLALSDGAEVLYKVTQPYSPEHEACLQWDDPQIGIDWPLDGPPCLSVKDRAGAKIADFGSY